MEEQGKTSRRKFIELLAKGVISASGIISSFPKAIFAQERKVLEKRPLGKSGFQATILGLGGTILPKNDERTAIATVKTCLELGVNYFDTASQYGDGESERRLGLGLNGEDQSKIWVTTKTLRRTYSESKVEITQSLKRLNLKKPLDCIQLHAINDMETLNQVMSENGSFRACMEAKNAGLVRNIGITGHTRPSVLLEALRRYPFTTALVACGVADQFIGDFAGKFMPSAKKQGVGIIAMKVFGEGKLVNKLSLEKMLHFSLSQPVDTAIIGMGTPEHVKENYSYALSFRPMSASEKVLFSASAKPYGNDNFLWWKRGA